MSGFFITFEGCEGSGKSTHAEKIYQFLIKKGYPVILTHEPGGTKISDKIRELLLSQGDNGVSKNLVPNAELMLYLASRAQHVEELIIPALKKGSVILCDRYSDATVAYQGYGRGLDIEMLKKINDFVSFDVKPDYTILLDIDPKTGLERSKRINKTYASSGELDRMESQGLRFHRLVREGYLKIANDEPERVKVFDSSLSIEETYSMIENVVLEKIKDNVIPKSSRSA